MKGDACQTCFFSMILVICACSAGLKFEKSIENEERWRGEEGEATRWKLKTNVKTVGVNDKCDRKGVVTWRVFTESEN